MTIYAALSRATTAFSVQLSEDLVSLWEEALAEADNDEIDIAVSKLIKTSKFMPRPADVWTEIDRLRVERSPAPEPVVEHWARRTFRCPGCEDTGLRTVWHPKAMRGAVRFVRGEINERMWRGTLASCVVKCDCDKGQERRLSKEKKSRPTAAYKGETYEPGELIYKSDIMVEVDKNLSPTEQVEALLNWAKFYEEPKPDNYVSAFDDFD